MVMARTKDSTSSRSPLQIDLAQRIARLIKDGTFAPGQHLTEKGLAEQYDVSRTPVRAALTMLEEEGFVESRANSGFWVAKGGHRLRLERLAPSSITEDELFRLLITDRGRGKLRSTFTDADLQAGYPAPKSMLTRVMLRLTREGLIERRKGHGWSFTESLDTKEAHDESYRFRAIVESAGLREPTFKIDVDELRKCRAAQERFLAHATGAKALAEFFEMNLEFHEMLARFSGNRFIVRAVAQQNQLRRFLEYTYFEDHPISLVDSTKEHLQIIDALEQGDSEWAAALMQRHLGAASRR